MSLFSRLKQLQRPSQKSSAQLRAEQYGAVNPRMDMSRGQMLMQIESFGGRRNLRPLSQRLRIEQLEQAGVARSRQNESLNRNLMLGQIESFDKNSQLMQTIPDHVDDSRKRALSQETHASKPQDLAARMGALHSLVDKANTRLDKYLDQRRTPEEIASDPSEFTNRLEGMERHLKRWTGKGSGLNLSARGEEGEGLSPMGRVSQLAGLLPQVQALHERSEDQAPDSGDRDAFNERVDAFVSRHRKARKSILSSREENRPTATQKDTFDKKLEPSWNDRRNADEELREIDHSPPRRPRKTPSTRRSPPSWNAGAALPTM